MFFFFTEFENTFFILLFKKSFIDFGPFLPHMLSVTFPTFRHLLVGGVVSIFHWALIHAPIDVWMGKKLFISTIFFGSTTINTSMVSLLLLFHLVENNPYLISPLSFSIFFTGDGQQQQQYFAERPQNTSVREGQMVVLRCRVGNQQGRAQWTKEGFALGKKT